MTSAGHVMSVIAGHPPCMKPAMSPPNIPRRPICPCPFLYINLAISFSNHHSIEFHTPISTMNFMSTILIVGLAVVAASGAEFKPREGGRDGNLAERAYAQAMSRKDDCWCCRKRKPLIGMALARYFFAAPILQCATCALPQNLNLSGTVDLAKDLGPVLQKFLLLVSNVIGGVFLNLENLQQAVTAVLTSARDNIGPFFDRLRVAVQHVVTCPAFRTFVKNLKNNTITVLDSLTETWPTLLNGTDTGSLLSALSQALVIAAPDIILLVRDATIDLITIVNLPILGAVTCPTLVTVVWKLLDPSNNGPVTAPLILAFESLAGQSGPTPDDVISNILNVFALPPVSIPVLSGIDLVQLIKGLTCGIVQLLGLGGFSGVCP